MATRTFNKLAAFGVVHPPYQGATHYQDGGYFGPDGKLLFEDEAAVRKPPKTVVNETIVTDADGKETKTIETTVVPDIEPGDPKVILTGWLKGEIVLKHPEVVKYVKAGFATVLLKKADIIDYLVNTANLVPAELVKVV